MSSITQLHPQLIPKVFQTGIIHRQGLRVYKPKVWFPIAIIKRKIWMPFLWNSYYISILHYTLIVSHNYSHQINYKATVIPQGCFLYGLFAKVMRIKMCLKQTHSVNATQKLKWWNQKIRMSCITLANLPNNIT